MDAFKERFEKLNEQQKRAVNTIEGPVMVIAGPGSGKTELLSLRVVNILRNEDVSPSNILCLTFTDSAAFNMRERLIGLLGRDAYKIAIYTFHSFGVEIINKFPEYFYKGASFLPADDITQTEILESIFKDLEYDNPLKSEHNDQFIYLHKTKKSIEYLKKAGLNPSEFKKILKENKRLLIQADLIIQPIFSERVTKKMYEPAVKAIEAIDKLKRNPIPSTFEPLTISFCKSLTDALTNAQELNTTKPLTEFKKTWMRNGADEKIHFSDFLNMGKMEALADIYDKYAARMHEEGYYDYNDMILDAISMLENNAGVRLDIQEHYQYVLVDEFQDTNDAQIRLLHLLTDNPVNEKRPNIMIVGDDDQAIYKFQGAEISNIIDFKKTYRDPAMIVLKENYRSTQNILDAARHIIKKGVGRLEGIMPDIQKELIAANIKISEGSIHSKEFASRELEYHWITSEVKKLLSEKIPAKEIAIIAREHKDLEALVSYFHAERIPISYERQQNVLLEPHIRQLITMGRFIDSLMKESEDADNFLPEILNYPFWNIDRAAIWELSIKARKENKPWLKAMTESGGNFKKIANFFIDLAGRSKFETAEEIINELIGGPQLTLPEENTDDEIIARHDMFSPFRSYYFNKKKFEKDRADYLRFLSSLHSFIGSLREYRRGKNVSIENMIEFVDMHEKNKLAINNISPFLNAEEAVQLMTAHKSKGLEFDAVFIINCQENVWAENNRGNDVPLPMNLPIFPNGDNLDDQLRLFYVAITRAKRKLYLTSYKTDHRGKESTRLGFLAPSDDTSKDYFKAEFIDLKNIVENPEELLASQWDMKYGKPFIQDEKILLKPILDSYQLSVTHLQNFLDVANAGPLAFFEKNLLMFPEPKSPSGALGSALHNTIKRAYEHYKNQEKLPSNKDILIWFEDYLRQERLNKKQLGLLLKRGKNALEAFYEKKKGSFSVEDKIELNFKTQGVVINEAHLTGKIDRIITKGDEMIVSDFKSGKAINSWSSGDAYEKIKAWRYKQQIIFYKLLIENSRDFGGKYFVNKGIIEFIEPSHKNIVDLNLDIEKEDVEKLTALINVVYRKIKSLDFPDISGYSKDIYGIQTFEEDLLKNG
ncbi:MAG: ATP-dependent DNA helicase [Candidatus Woesebacteria bacterium]|nr:ATP-dependent DNA helicase [Candidatus Woesebacteria bacterium]